MLLVLVLVLVIVQFSLVVYSTTFIVVLLGYSISFYLVCPSQIGISLLPISASAGLAFVTARAGLAS